MPDLTFVGKTDGKRLLLNPNVLVEYGWALKEVTYSRIVPVMNSAFGEPSWETMPFDMRHLRHPLTYYLKEDTPVEERSKIKSELSDKLSAAIELIIKKNLITEVKRVQYKGVSATTKPSTFLKPNETFTEAGRFHAVKKKVFVPDTQHLFLRLIPSIPLSNIKTSKQAYDLALAGNLTSLGVGPVSSSYGRNKHGSHICHVEDDKALNLTQLFKTGELWGIDADTIDKEKVMNWSEADFGYLPCTSLERAFLYTLKNYLKFAAETLKLHLPLRFVAGVTDVEGYRMALPPGFGERFAGLVVDDNIIHEGTITDYDVKATDILRPFFEYLWEECGLERPDKEVLG